MRAMLLIAGTVSIAAATFQASGSGREEPSLQSLVDQLNEIAVRSRKERAADRWLQNALEELVARYDWPWSRELLDEGFVDGDYTRDPAWEVLSGQFWIDGRLGLRSRTQARQEPARAQEGRQPEADLGQAIIGALMDQAFRGTQQGGQQPDSPDRRYEPSVIRVPLQIPRVFSVQADFSLHNAPSESGQIEFSIYQGTQGGSGYSLILNAGARPSIELISEKGGRTAVIDGAELEGVSDGHPHSLEWRSGNDGQIEVLLDDRRLIRTRDRSFKYPFREFRITNRKGDFAVAGVRIHGAE